MQKQAQVSLRISLLVYFSICPHAQAVDRNAVDEFCSSELVATFHVLSVGRNEERKRTLVRQHRDTILARQRVPPSWNSSQPLRAATSLSWDAYLTFLRGYLSGLDERVHWAKGRAQLVSILHATIEAQAGDAATKSALTALVTADSIVPMSSIIPLMESQPQSMRTYFQSLLPAACGDDALARGGIAFMSNGRKSFAFCPGALLEASVEVAGNAARWRDSVRIDGLYFTAFHEFGHLIGADSASPHRSLYDGLVRCLRRTTPFNPSHENEVIADIWGAIALVNAIDSTPNLSAEAKVELVARNLSPFQESSPFSPHHLPYGARQQMVLAEVCPYLRSVQTTENRCRLSLTPNN